MSHTNWSLIFWGRFGLNAYGPFQWYSSHTYYFVPRASHDTSHVHVPIWNGRIKIGCWMTEKAHLQKWAVRAVTNSDYWAHTASLFSKLKILDIFQINTLDIAKFMFCYHNNLLPPLFSICLWQTVESIHMTQEQPVIIACIPVARISKNSQFFTKDPGSGTVFLPLLPICQAFLPLKTKC